MNGKKNGCPLTAWMSTKFPLEIPAAAAGRVEGVLVHYNRSCRPWCGALQEVEHRLRVELNIPVVSFDGDQGDPSAFAAAQFEMRLDALVKQMEARRK